MATKSPSDKAKTGPNPSKHRNKDSAETQKVSENVAEHPESVNSDVKQGGTVHKNHKGIAPAEKQRMIGEIIDRISEGEPLRQICREENMPSWRTVYDWMAADEEFGSRFARAREKGEDAIAQECMDIADNANNDWMERRKDDEKSEGWVLNGEHIQRSKLRIETRLKLLAKWNPRKWGEKLEVGGEGGGPLTVVVRDFTGRKKESEDGAAN